MLASFAANKRSESFIAQQENWGAISLMVLHNISSPLQLHMVLCRADLLEISAIASADSVTYKKKRGGSSPSPSAPCDTLSLHTLSVRETSMMVCLKFALISQMLCWEFSAARVRWTLLLNSFYWGGHFSTTTKRVVLHIPCWFLISTRQILAAQLSLRR